MERALIEYLANSLWQLPLLAGGAWLLLRIARPEPRMQHWVWLAVLAAAVVLPVRGMEGSHSATASIQTRTVAAFTAMPDAEIVPVPQTKAVRYAGEDWGRVAGRIRDIPLSVRTMDWLTGLYLAIVAFGGVRFAWRWRAARQLVKRSRETVLSDKVLEIFQDCGRRLELAVLPELRECGQVRIPAVVGAWRPVLLLPENFIQHSEEELKAALCHELAHVRRRDWLVNLLCQMTALPLVWHPAIYAVKRRIHVTREMVCDAMAAEAMRSETGYARCLVALAASMVGGDGLGQAQVGLFDNNTLEERVMRLTKTKIAMSRRAKMAHIAGGAAAMAAALVLAATFHLTPILAQATAPAQSTPAAAKPSIAASQKKPSAIAHGRKAKVFAAKGEYIHRWTGSDGKPFVIANHQRREPTVEERHRIEKRFQEQMSKMNLNMAEMQRQVKVATAQINSPEFKKQMAEMQKQIQDGELKRQAQMAAMEAQFKAPNMADIQRQVKAATAQINSPEFKKQMAEIQKQIQDGELKRQAQMAAMEAQFKAPNMADIQRQVKAATAQIDSRELEQQMAEMQRAVRNGELQREKAIQILKDAETRLEKMQSK